MEFFLSSQLFLSWFSICKMLQPLHMILICIIIVVYFIICMQKSFRNHISNVQKRQNFRLRRSEKHGFARANPARAEFQIRRNPFARSDRTHIGVWAPLLGVTGVLETIWGCPITTSHDGCCKCVKHQLHLHEFIQRCFNATLVDYYPLHSPWLPSTRRPLTP